MFRSDREQFLESCVAQVKMISKAGDLQSLYTNFKLYEIPVLGRRQLLKEFIKNNKRFATLKGDLAKLALENDDTFVLTELMHVDHRIFLKKLPDGETLVHKAANLQNGIGLIQELAKKDPVLLSIKNKAGETPLHIAVQQGRVENAKALVRADSRLLHEFNHQGQTPVDSVDIHFQEERILPLYELDSTRRASMNVIIELARAKASTDPSSFGQVAQAMFKEADLLLEKFQTREAQLDFNIKLFKASQVILCQRPDLIQSLKSFSWLQLDLVFKRITVKVVPFFLLFLVIPPFSIFLAFAVLVLPLFTALMITLSFFMIFLVGLSAQLRSFFSYGSYSFLSSLSELAKAASDPERLGEEKRPVAEYEFKEEAVAIVSRETVLSQLTKMASDLEYLSENEECKANEVSSEASNIFKLRDSTLPFSLVAYIYSYFSFAQMAMIRIVNKEMNILSQAAITFNFKNTLFWEKRFQYHFPYLYSVIVPGYVEGQAEKMDWRNAFWEVSQEEYSRQQHLFLMVKEGDNFECHKYSYPRYLEDKGGQSLYDWTWRVGNVSILEKYYEFEFIVTIGGPPELMFQQNAFTPLSLVANRMVQALLFFPYDKKLLQLIAEYKEHVGPLMDYLDDPVFYPWEWQPTIFYGAALVGYLPLFQDKALHNMLTRRKGDIIYQCLLLATYQGHTEVVRYLSSLDIRYDWQKALSSVKRNHHPLIENALKKVCVFPLIHTAASQGRLAVLKILLEVDSSLINFKIKERDRLMTPIVFALWRGHFDIADYLISQGAELSTEDIKKVAAEEEASKYPYLQQALQQSHDILMEGKNSIHIAAENGCLNTVKLLINFNRALLNQASEEGETPLIYAIRGGFQEIVEFFIQKGAVVTVSTRAPNTEGHGRTAHCIGQRRMAIQAW